MCEILLACDSVMDFGLTLAQNLFAPMSEIVWTYV